MQVSCHNASKTADKVVYQPTSTALLSWLTTTPPKQTSFIQRLHHEPRGSVSGGQWAYTAYHPQTGEASPSEAIAECQTRGSRPHQIMLKERLALTPSPPIPSGLGRATAHHNKAGERTSEPASPRDSRRCIHTPPRLMTASVRFGRATLSQQHEIKCSSTYEDGCMSVAETAHTLALAAVATTQGW